MDALPGPVPRRIRRRRPRGRPAVGARPPPGCPRARTGRIGLAALSFIVLGKPGSGNASAPELLPGFWRVAGSCSRRAPAARRCRDAAYFDGHALAEPALVLAAWAIAGAALILVGRCADRPATPPSRSAARHDPPSREWHSVAHSATRCRTPGRRRGTAAFLARRAGTHGRPHPLPAHRLEHHDRTPPRWPRHTRSPRRLALRPRRPAPPPSLTGLRVAPSSLARSSPRCSAARLLAYAIVSHATRSSAAEHSTAIRAQTLTVASPVDEPRSAARCAACWRRSRGSPRVASPDRRRVPRRRRVLAAPVPSARARERASRRSARLAGRT